jgi:glycosyltransferase involved in cell wall biosynthesis
MTSDKFIGIISTYPKKGRKDSRESALAWYTKNLMLNLDNLQRDKIVILSNIHKDKTIYTENGVEINRCWNRGKFSFFKEILTEIKKYTQLKVIHIQQEFNLFGNPLTVFLYLYLLFRLKRMGKMTVVTYHGVVSQQSIDKRFAAINQINLPVFAIKLYFKLIFSISAFFIDTTIVHGEYFKSVLVRDYKFNPQKVKSLHIGGEDVISKFNQAQARKILGVPQDKRVIIFMGAWATYKGIDLLIDAFKLLDKEKYFLILTGGKQKRLEDDKNYNLWYESILSKTLDISNMLKSDYIPEEKIDLYLQASDLLILPHSILFGPSGFIYIAISYEKPFLASSVFDKIFDNKKIIFEMTPKKLAEKIEDFYVNKKEYVEYVQKLKKIWSWKTLAQGTFFVYTI